jgi:hypothetical protein
MFDHDDGQPFFMEFLDEGSVLATSDIAIPEKSSSRIKRSGRRAMARAGYTKIYDYWKEVLSKP